MAGSESSKKLVPVHCWWRNLFVVEGRKHAFLSFYFSVAAEFNQNLKSVLVESQRHYDQSEWSSMGLCIYEVCGCGCLRKRERGWEMLRGIRVCLPQHTHWGQRIICGIGSLYPPSHGLAFSVSGRSIATLATLFFGHGGLEFLFPSFLSMEENVSGGLSLLTLNILKALWLTKLLQVRSYLQKQSIPSEEFLGWSLDD